MAARHRAVHASHTSHLNPDPIRKGNATHHGHFGHIADAVELAKKHKPPIVAMPETCAWLESKGVENTKGMNKGGTQKAGEIDVTMVNAVHSCGIQDGDKVVYGGEACGYRSFARRIYALSRRGRPYSAI